MPAQAKRDNRHQRFNEGVIRETVSAIRCTVPCSVTSCAGFVYGQFDFEVLLGSVLEPILRLIATILLGGLRIGWQLFREVLELGQHFLARDAFR
jgi:hypothetical protein